MHFAKLDDSPMFRKQVQTIEESCELLRERCLKFYKGSRKYTEGLGEGYDGDIAFASALEIFGGGHNDPISVAFGGPVMTKFTIALREIGTYKEVLRSQIEHILNDRLMQFVDVDLHDVKDARKRFDKASLIYDQVRDRYLSLRKGTKPDVASAIEDELHSARSSFEQARFNLVTALSNVESKKRFEFLEAVSGTMDAHLRYFKQGYELLHQMEPYIQQVLAYAQQSRERSNYDQAALIERMQEFKRQIDRESRWSPSVPTHSPSALGDGIQAIGRSSHKMIEAVMQSAAAGKVQTIRQGYLSKRSSNLRGDWKRRFFVLDSRGMLYYYRKQNSRPSGGPISSQRGHGSGEHGSGLLSRWFSSHYHGGVHDEKAVARHTVNLLTSTIKVDADQSDLRFCFRIISPTKNYTLQAESAMDQMDWIEKITGVIASLLSSQSPEQRLLRSPTSGHHRTVSESSSFDSSTDLDHSTLIEDHSSEKGNYSGGGSGYLEHSVRSVHHHRGSVLKHEKPIDALRKVCGNDTCADCGSPEPDWASLNLGILLCIECSGVHRNLGVHISKVRSLTLDVRVWETSVINLFQSLGNTFANTIWEELLQSSSVIRRNHDDVLRGGSDNKGTAHHVSFSKPRHSDSISVKEKFIQAKYTEKYFVNRDTEPDFERHMAASCQLWQSVRTNDKKSAYRLIITSTADVNAIHTHQDLPSPSPLSLSSPDPSLTLAKAIYIHDRQHSMVSIPDQTVSMSSFDAASSSCSGGISGETEARVGDQIENYEGFSLLHLACREADLGMVELLLQYGANVNSVDARGRAPLHHCILKGRALYAKLLLARGADPHASDMDGKTPLQYAIDFGTIDDDEILLLLEDPIR
ncbi:ADP-ribosylation factor GTPase-activating protein AGD3 isoform X1 [Carex littledalei]|uniref:ADP-ribosylation factor GTPase-activating protein AGD3 isoform X1 n=1 Tax=Carex littledalei TaxID=544730 RepID=A0A833V7L1_9POAL|nr:ADP-ribosylation factor GTPase-activating protein AGD3 isoform X1 [Carex littledalei]